jgi:hypothetical protein
MSNRNDQILEQADCFIIYRSSDMGPPVPYHPQERPETPDRPNRGFIDLRDNMNEVPNVFEAKDVPGLQILLQSINQPGSAFMSLGCERKLNQLDTPNGDATCYLNSYCEMTYRMPEQQSERNLRELAFKLAEQSGLEMRNWVQIELGIELMKSFFGQSGGFCLIISVSGYGRNPDEAWAAHEYGCRRIAEVFDQTITN